MEKDPNGNWTSRDSWKETYETLGFVLFLALVIWACHMEWAAERASARQPHSPMLMCDVGC